VTTTKKTKPAAASQPLQAVVTLKPESWLDASSPAADAAPLMEKLLERITKQSGMEPERVQLFPNIGAFSISADPTFIEQLTKEPEVLKAAPNVREESMKIEPVRKRPVAYGQRTRKKR
jgi:hypothetical protein